MLFSDLLQGQSQNSFTNNLPRSTTVVEGSSRKERKFGVVDAQYGVGCSVEYARYVHTWKRLILMAQSWMLSLEGVFEEEKEIPRLSAPRLPFWTLLFQCWSHLCWFRHPLNKCLQEEWSTTSMNHLKTLVILSAIQTYILLFWSLSKIFHIAEFLALIILQVWHVSYIVHFL